MVLTSSILALSAANLGAQPFTLLHTFGLSPADGMDPSQNGLVLSGNRLFGATRDGASPTNIYSGCVFAINTDGSGYAVLHVFDAGTEGYSPDARVVVSGDRLYGTTQVGGPNGYGTIFSLSTNGTGFAIVHAFASWDGTAPRSLLLSGATLYGTTQQGGVNQYGTVYSVGTDGSEFTVLHDFSAAIGNSLKTNVDGINPAGLTLAGNTLYGNASLGGANGWGTLFSLNTDGSSFNVLHNFKPGNSGDDGTEPLGELIVSSNSIYGTTIHGGAHSRGAVYSISNDGSGFTLLHSFSGTDGDEPYAGVILSGNTLYGTTISGGTGREGTVFALNTDGTAFNVLYNFSGYASGNNTNTDGALPEAGSVLSGNTLYGVAAAGGANAGGTAFAFKILPTISNIGLSGGNLVLTGANAVAGSQYVVLKSSDAARPLNQWTPLVTNTPAGSGSFTITINAVDPQESQAFYALKMQ